MAEIYWERYPQVAQWPSAQRWLTIQAHLGLAANTIDAYGRALEDYLGFCSCHAIAAESATTAHLSEYVHDLTTRPHPRGKNTRSLHSSAGLANATLHQRLTAVRLWYDYLLEEGMRQNNPVGRGRYTTGKGFGGGRDKGLIPRYRRLPWIPTEEQWQAILRAAKEEPLRNRLMLAFAYDAALRREELCALATGDIDPAHRILRVRAETTKNMMDRAVPYSEETGALYAAYLRERQTLSRSRGPLFLSQSDRNLAHPISIGTWSKAVKRLAERSEVPQLTTHTFRHLCLTDLARSGWDLHEIATFAGHRSLESTMRYIHLTGRDLSDKLYRGMQSIHRWRVMMMGNELT